MNTREPGPIWGGWWFWEPPTGKTKELNDITDDQIKYTRELAEDRRRAWASVRRDARSGSQ
jgi:hypothetical protein